MNTEAVVGIAIIAIAVAFTLWEKVISPAFHWLLEEDDDEA